MLSGIYEYCKICPKILPQSGLVQNGSNERPCGAAVHPPRYIINK